jgi:hypothetical protein
MANVFETFASASLGTALTKVGSHTCGASTTETVIGLTVANRTTSAVKVDITYNNGSSEFYIVKDAPVASGGAITPIGGDQKIVLTTGDSIKVKSNTASSVDAVMSMLQIT